MKSIKNILFLMIVSGIWHVCHIPMPAQSYSFRWETVDSIEAGISLQGVDIACADDLHCISTGTVTGDQLHYTFIRATTDGGETWRYVLSDSLKPDSPGFPPRPKRVAHPTPQVMLMAADDATMFRSLDAGETWERFQTGKPDIPLSSLHMYDAASGIVITGSSYMLRTQDSGKTWEDFILPDTLADYGVGYAIHPGRNTIIAQIGKDSTYLTARTDDGGETWRTAPSNRYAPRIDFVDSLHGWGVGTHLDDGSLYAGQDVITRTTDGGATWEELVHEHGDPPFGVGRIDFIDTLRGFVGGAVGKLLYTSDGGESWEQLPIDESETRAVRNLVYTSPSRAFILFGDALVLRLTPTISSVTVEAVTDASVQVFQSEGSLRVQSDPPGSPISRVSLYTLLGEQLVVREVEGGVSVLDVSVAEYPSGLYVLVVEQPGRSPVTRKIVLSQ